MSSFPLQDQYSAQDYLQLLGTDPEHSFDRLSRLAAQTFDAPVALITLIAGDRQWFKSSCGIDLPEQQPNTSFCSHTVQLNAPDDVLVVPDAAADPRFAGLMLDTGPTPLRFYAGTPLRAPDGTVLGSLCIFDHQPRKGLGPSQRNTLRELAAVIMDVIQQRLVERQLRQTQQQLWEQQQQLQLTLSRTRMVVWTLDLRSGALTIQADVKALGILPQHLPTNREEMLALIHPEDRAEAADQLRRAAERGGEYDVQVRLRFPDGRILWTGSRGHVQQDDQKRPARLLAVTFDRTEQQQAEQALIESEAILRQVIDQSHDAVYVKDIQGRYQLVNPAAARMMGRSPEEILGQTDAAFLKTEDMLQVVAVDREVIARQAPVTYERPLSFSTRGELVVTTKFPYVRGAEIRGVIGVTRDITLQMQLEQVLRDTNSGLEAKVQERTQSLEQLNDRLQHDALHDHLTDLPNRALFTQRLEQAIRQHRNGSRAAFAVVFLDFDRFKLVNDSLGHAAGDELLLGIARRLRQAIGSVHTVARLGGDEFTVLLEQVGSVADIQDILGVLQDHLSIPFRVSGQDLRMTASIGVTTSALPYERAEDALRDADIAMYRAKSERKGSVTFFEPAMYERQVALMNLQRDLRNALDAGELRVYYQPILRLTDQTVMGIEALVRWQHPQHGLISPAEFIPLAEESGLICEIDLWVMQVACEQLGRWNAGRAQPLQISVNLSPQHFMQPGLVGQVRQILQRTGTDPHLLRLEITERLLMSPVAALNTLQDLRAMGIEIVIDDFGTGYSSLSYLQQLPLDGLKIDRSFVAAVHEQPEVLHTIVSLGRTLNMHVVAEGLEHRDQVQRVLEMECELGQGYVFAQPTPAPNVPEMLRRLGGAARTE